MKYFKKELWIGFNSDDDATFQRTNKQWSRNRAAYIRQLERVKPRLSKNAAQFFSRVSLHDGRLLAFVIGDHIDYSFNKLHSLSRNSGSPSARIEVLNFEQQWLYILRYTKVKRVLFDFPSSKPLFYDEGDSIDDWGYDELTAADDVYLRHEILFSSGATLLIEFKHFAFKRTGIMDGGSPVF